MSRIGDGFGELSGNDNYTFIDSNGDILVIEKRAHNQPNYNNPSDESNYAPNKRAAFIGSNVLKFSIESQTWQQFEFPALSEEENIAELVLTDSHGNVYILLYTNYGIIEFKNLFKWNGEQFESIEFAFPDPIEIKNEDENGKGKLEFFAADGFNDLNEIVIFTNDGNYNIKIFGVDINSSSIRYITEIPADKNGSLGLPIGGFVSGNQVVISYGMKYLSRWEVQRFLFIDLESKEIRDIDTNGEYEECPQITEKKPITTSKIDQNWLTAGGYGSNPLSFIGTVWVLKNALAGEGIAADWVKLEGIELEEGNIVASRTNNPVKIYSVNKENVVEYTLGDEVFE